MQIVSPNETIALISLSTKIGDTTGMINLCIPHVVLEPIMTRLSVHHWFVSQKKSRNEEEIEALQVRVNKAQLSVVAEVGSSYITVNEFLHLSVGDVISLNHPINEGLQIKVGDKLKFMGNPGSVKGRLAIQISEIVREGDEEHE